METDQGFIDQPESVLVSRRPKTDHFRPGEKGVIQTVQGHARRDLGSLTPDVSDRHGRRRGIDVETPRAVKGLPGIDPGFKIDACFPDDLPTDLAVFVLTGIEIIQ